MDWHCVRSSEGMDDRTRIGRYSHRHRKCLFRHFLICYFLAFLIAVLCVCAAFGSDHVFFRLVLQGLTDSVDVFILFSSHTGSDTKVSILTSEILPIGTGFDRAREVSPFRVPIIIVKHVILCELSILNLLNLVRYLTSAYDKIMNRAVLSCRCCSVMFHTQSCFSMLHAISDTNPGMHTDSRHRKHLFFSCANFRIPYRCPSCWCSLWQTWGGVSGQLDWVWKVVWAFLIFYRRKGEVIHYKVYWNIKIHWLTLHSVEWVYVEANRVSHPKQNRKNKIAIRQSDSWIISTSILRRIVVGAVALMMLSHNYRRSFTWSAGGCWEGRKILLVLGGRVGSIPWIGRKCGDRLPWHLVEMVGALAYRQSARAGSML